MYTQGPLGIVAERDNRRISIFNTNTLEVVQQLPLDADVIDVAVSNDCQRAFVTSFYDKTMFQIDLSRLPARVAGSAVSQTYLEDVALSPDGRFALSVDGSGSSQDLVSYSARQNAIVSTLTTSAQAVAVSRCGFVLTAENFSNSVRRFTLRPDGTLEDSGQSFPTGAGPINIVFSPDGNFAFVANIDDGTISVLSTLFPHQVVLLENVPTSARPQSLIVSRDGRHVFVLTASTVDIFAFDPVAGSLTLLRSFAHGLNINSFYGVDQIALDACELRLFISAFGRVAAFTTYGLPLGNVAGVEGPGGIAICPCRPENHAREWSRDLENHTREWSRDLENHAREWSRDCRD